VCVCVCVCVCIYIYIYILYQYINKNNTSAIVTYGFRNNSWTEKTSFKLIIEILLALNNQLTVGGIFYDLGKAFDSVNHDLVLSKIEYYGFRPKTNALQRSYLSERYQRVLINNSVLIIPLFHNKTWCSSRFNTCSFVLFNLL
jgi:hypothetical protein